MATVRFNMNIKETIIQTAKQQMKPAWDRVNALIPGPEEGLKVYEIMFAKELPLLEQLPDGWFEYRNNMTIGKLLEEEPTVNLCLKFPKSVRWPHAIYDNEVFTMSKYYQVQVELKPHPVWDSLITQVRAYRAAYRTQAHKEDVYIHSIRVMLDAYTTVSPALKAWPPLWDLLPQQCKLDHVKVADKQQRKRNIPVDVDLDAITAISAAAKFGV